MNYIGANRSFKVSPSPSGSCFCVSLSLFAVSIVSSDEDLPSPHVLRRLCLFLSVLIFISNAGGILFGSVLHLLSFFSFCSQVSLAVASLAVAALEAPPPSGGGPPGGPQGELGGDEPRYARRKSSLLERAVVACLVGK